MHGTAGLFLHWLCHERGVQPMVDGGLPHGAFKQKCLISQFQRATMIKIYFHLRGTSLMAERIDIKPLNITMVIDFFK